MYDMYIKMLIISLGNAFFTDFFFFCLGNPENEELKKGRILSYFGDKFRYLRDSYSKAGLNPYKILTCPFCFNFYPVSVYYFIFFLPSHFYFESIFMYLWLLGCSHVALKISRNVFI